MTIPRIDDLPRDHPLRRARAPGGRGQQSGQALVLGLMMLAICMALMLMLSRTGSMISARQRVVQTADAAAYSAGIWRARVLNTLAYSNRTIVAQEVAVAQAVTLAAWARYFETLAGHAQWLAIAYPPAGPVLSALGQGAAVSAGLSDQAAAIEVAARGAPGLGLTAMLEHAQGLLLQSANGFGLSAVAQEVARAHDPGARAFALSDQGRFAAFVRHYAGPGERDRLREVVLASLDPFTQGPRDRDIRLPLPSSCAGRSTQLDKWTLWYRKRGRTQLSDDLSSWQALDAGSVHDWRGSGLLGLGGCRDRETLPLGWGMASADLSTRPPTPGSTNSVQEVAATNPRAVEQAAVQASSYAYRGLAAVRDLADLSTPFPVSRLAVLALLEREPSVLDAMRAAIPGAEPNASSPSMPRRLTALSSAEVFFRPPPQQGRIEYASLFSPFWQVRLVAPDSIEEQEAARYAP